MQKDSTEKMADYKTSKDYSLLVKLMKNRRIICLDETSASEARYFRFWEYADGENIEAFDLFGESRPNEKEFIELCKDYNISFIVPEKISE